MNVKLRLHVVSSKYESSFYLLFLLYDCRFRANAWYIQMLMSIQIFVFKFIKELLYTQSYLFCSFPIRVHGGEYLWEKGIFNFHCMFKIH